MLEALLGEGLHEAVQIDNVPDHLEAKQSIAAISARGESYALCIVGESVDGEFTRRDFEDVPEPFFFRP